MVGYDGAYIKKLLIDGRSRKKCNTKKYMRNLACYTLQKFLSLLYISQKGISYNSDDLSYDASTV